jgi:uncharacterized protein YrzB (UPF0473 family)
MADNHNHEHDEDRLITIVDEDGNEELYEILLTFESEEFDESYVLLYPAGAAEDEEVEVLAFTYEEPEDDNLVGELGDVETDEEWDMIEEVLGAFVEEEEPEE